MTQNDFGRRLALISAGGVVIAVALCAVMGRQWFSFYGVASAVLATLPFVAVALWRRFTEVGKSRWRTLLYVVPAAALALIQIGFWVMFFKTGAGNPTLGFVRGVLRENLGPYSPIAAAALLVFWAWLFWSAASDADNKSVTQRP